MVKSLIVTVVLAGAALLFMLGPRHADATGVLGDGNCSGNVDSIDALVALQFDAAILANGPCLSSADVNGDRHVTAVDATLILQFQARLLGRLGPDLASKFADVIAVGDRHICAVATDGTVRCWSENISGALGDGTTTDHIWPNDVPSLSGITSIAAGLDHTCALTATGGVKCWGWNQEGQVGDGMFVNRLVPVDVAGLSSGVEAVAAGGTHTCAVMTKGNVRCWGGNYAGELGASATQTCTRFNFSCSSSPLDVEGIDHVAALSLGSRHTCALTSVGGVKCWGSNDMGQLGDGTTDSRSTPADVPGLTFGVIAISAGAEHTCAVTSDHNVKCWGWNVYAQLGAAADDTCGAAVSQHDPCSKVPVDVGQLSDVVALDSGYNHNCALTTQGAIKCWGTDGFGVIGAPGSESCANGTSCSSTPLDVDGLGGDATAIAAGGSRSCAIVNGGDLKCWGEDIVGELGPKEDCSYRSLCSYTPVDIPGFVRLPEIV